MSSCFTWFTLVYSSKNDITCSQNPAQTNASPPQTPLVSVTIPTSFSPTKTNKTMYLYPGDHIPLQTLNHLPHSLVIITFPLPAGEIIMDPVQRPQPRIKHFRHWPTCLPRC